MTFISLSKVKKKVYFMSGFMRQKLEFSFLIYKFEVYNITDDHIIFNIRYLNLSL